MPLPERDLRALKRLLEDGRDDDRDPAAPLPFAVLEGLQSFLSCDMLTFTVVDSGAQWSPIHQQVPVDPADADPAEFAAATATYYRHYWGSASCSYPERTGDLDSVIRTSDFYTLPQFRSTGMWSEYLRPYNIARELITCVGGVPGRTLRLVGIRGPGRDFDERDRSALWLVRPHLYQLFCDRAKPADLTPRQRELLRLVAAGHTNRQIARHLGVRESTVRKHLEHIFRRLQVTNRTAAVSRAFPNGDVGI